MFFPDGRPLPDAATERIRVETMLFVDGRRCGGAVQVAALAAGEKGPDDVTIEDFEPAARRIVMSIGRLVAFDGDSASIASPDAPLFLEALMDWPRVFCRGSNGERTPIAVLPHFARIRSALNGFVPPGTNQAVALEIPGIGRLAPSGAVHLCVGAGRAWLAFEGVYVRVRDADVAKLLSRIGAPCGSKAREALSGLQSADSIYCVSLSPTATTNRRVDEHDAVRVVRAAPRLQVALDYRPEDQCLAARAAFRYERDVVPVLERGEVARVAERRLIVRDAPAEERLLASLEQEHGFRRQGADVFVLRDMRHLWRFLRHGVDVLRSAADVVESPGFRRFAAGSCEASLEIETVGESGGGVGERAEDEEALSASGWTAFRVLLRDSTGNRLPLPRKSAGESRGQFRMREDGWGILALSPRDRARLDFVKRYSASKEQEATGDVAIRRALIPEVLARFHPRPERISGDWRRVARALSTPVVPGEFPDFHSICTRLRRYQRAGAAWVLRLQKVGFNAILADEMGLGKTVQALAVLAYRRFQLHVREPSIVVCPSSLIDNWRSEAERFVPELRVTAVRGPDRRRLIRRIEGECDLVITSYALLRRDAALYADIRFDCAILDEAQHIKNPHTRNAGACKALQSRHRLILTGTPLENHVMELWSLFDFLEPGLLPRPSGKDAGPEAGDEYVEEIRRIVRPFILRRTKEQVTPELPPKRERVLYVELSPAQRRLYRHFLSRACEAYDESLRDPSGRSRMHVFALLTRLRQVCAHPALLPPEVMPESSRHHWASAKTEALEELLFEAIDSGRRMLVFSQFASFLRLFRERLSEIGVAHEYLDGTTTERQERVDRFNADASIPVFLISLRAGGVGLNLTGADTVVHYDPWWNPMVEQQATDRTHRIGQTRSVDVIRIVARDTIEERILRLQARKQRLFDKIVSSARSAPERLSTEELAFLLGIEGRE